MDFYILCFKQKTAYEVRISDWSSDVCSSDLFALVRSYMVHHHGMTLGALGNVLFENLHVRWFHTDPHVRTVDLLLNERIPWELPPEIARVEVREPQATPESAIPDLYSWTPNRRYGNPAWQVLGNGRLSTRIRTDGAGSIGWNQNALTRVAPGDPEAGHWLYLRDIDGGDVWTATGGPFPQPEEPPQVEIGRAHV